MNNQLKCAIKKDTYDDKGFLNRTSYYGKDKKPCLGNEGWSKSVREMDEYGNVVKQSFYDIEGKPTDPKIMVPVGIAKYDKWGNMIYLASMDGKGNFIMNPQNGCSISRTKYDIRGNVIMQSFYSEKDKPILNSNFGYHKFTRTYDSRGNMLSEAYWKSEKEPMRVNGVHKKILKYDSNGNNTEESYWDIDGKPATNNGFHRVTYKYNKNGKPLENAYWNSKGKRAAGANGMHKMTISYKEDEETPVLLNMYDIYNRNIVKAKWNGNEWVPINGNVGASNNIPVSKSSNWMSDVKSLNSQLPMDLGDDTGNLTIQSAVISGSNSFTLYFTIPYSKYEISKEQLNTYILYVNVFAEGVKNELPGGVRMTCILSDSKNRELTRV